MKLLAAGELPENLTRVSAMVWFLSTSEDDFIVINNGLSLQDQISLLNMGKAVDQIYVRDFQRDAAEKSKIKPIDGKQSMRSCSIFYFNPALFLLRSCPSPKLWPEVVGHGAQQFECRDSHERRAYEGERDLP